MWYGLSYNLSSRLVILCSFSVRDQIPGPCHHNMRNKFNQQWYFLHCPELIKKGHTLNCIFYTIWLHRVLSFPYCLSFCGVRGIKGKMLKLKALLRKTLHYDLARRQNIVMKRFSKPNVTFTSTLHSKPIKDFRIITVRSFHWLSLSSFSKELNISS